MKKTQPQGEIFAETLTVLLRLSTRGWLVLKESQDLKIDVYPASMLQLLKKRMDSTRVEAMKLKILEKLNIALLVVERISKVGDVAKMAD